tara:strand:+ start:1300 stop:1485 length:186 start_codon:yes stop_codon:yes gene_type:complete
MSKISREGYEQIQVIKNALDSMYDKLSGLRSLGKKEVFPQVQEEFSTIAEIVDKAGSWEEV